MHTSLVLMCMYFRYRSLDQS